MSSSAPPIEIGRRPRGRSLDGYARFQRWWSWLGGHRHPLLVVVASVGIAAAVGLGAAHVAGVARVFRVIHHVDPVWFAVCLAAEAVAYAGYVLMLHETARVDGGPRLGLRHTAQIVAAGFGAFFAASASGGFKVDYLALRNAGARRKEALARVLGLGMLEYSILAPAALGAALAIIFDFGKQPDPSLTLPWLAVVPGFAVAVWLTHPRRRRLTDARDCGRVRVGVAHLVAGLTILRKLTVAPHRYGAAFVGCALYWAGEIGCLWAALTAFHAHVPVPAVILAYATGYVVTRRSLPAGGVGVAEAFLTVSLYWLGVPLAAAVVGVFAYRIFNFWLALVPAFAAAPAMRVLRANMEQADDELARERLAA
jgi:uncharacterized membrane protein YbhN (UPF0104 family)